MFYRPVVLCLVNCITVIVEVIEGRVWPAVRMLVSPAVDTRRTFLWGGGGGEIFPHSNYEDISKVSARNLTSRLLSANSRLSPDGRGVGKVW